MLLRLLPHTVDREGVFFRAGSVLTLELECETKLESGLHRLLSSGREGTVDVGLKIKRVEAVVRKNNLAELSPKGG